MINRNKKWTTSLLLALLFSGIYVELAAQQSSLVYPGPDHKLVYEKYANQ